MTDSLMQSTVKQMILLQLTGIPKMQRKPEEQQAAVERQSSEVGATPSRSDAGKRSPEPSSGGRLQPSEGSQICLELVTPRGKSRGHEVLSPPDLPEAKKTTDTQPIARRSSLPTVSPYN